MNIKFKLLAINILFCITQNMLSITQPVIEYLKKNVGGSRQITLEHALLLADQRNVKTIVETGTARGGKMAFSGDGGFTIIFGYWASINNANLYSVDINPESLKGAKTVVGEYEKNVHLVLDDSVNFLKNFDKTIDFLYLDSFDFDFNNPLPSQMHHLHEIEAAYDKLAPHAIVMIDDCDLPHGGKGKFVIDYLQKKGWRLYIKSYQVILLRS